MIFSNSSKVLRKRHAALPVVGFFALALGPLALAQHGGGPPGGGGPPQGGMGDRQQPGGRPAGQGGQGGLGPFGRPSNGYPGNNPPPGSPDNAGAPASTMRGGLQLGPPGRWWNDDRFARSLGLDRNQQHRMDDIFKANKGQLVQFFKDLRHEESQLEKIARGRTLDEAQIDAQIDKVVQARSELEKANAHMLLEIRKQMTPEQIGRLDDHRPAPPPNEN